MSELLLNERQAMELYYRPGLAEGCKDRITVHTDVKFSWKARLLLLIGRELRISTRIDTEHEVGRTSAVTITHPERIVWPWERRIGWEAGGADHNNPPPPLDALHRVPGKGAFRDAQTGEVHWFDSHGRERAITDAELARWPSMHGVVLFPWAMGRVVKENWYYFASAPTRTECMERALDLSWRLSEAERIADEWDASLPRDMVASAMERAIKGPFRKDIGMELTRMDMDGPRG